MKLRYFIVYALWVGVGIYGGMHYEATRIQQTCESDAPTMLNGTPYICLTGAQAAGIAKRVHERGA